MDWIEQLMFTEDDLLVLGFHTVSRRQGYVLHADLGVHMCMVYIHFYSIYMCSTLRATQYCT